MGVSAAVVRFVATVLATSLAASGAASAQTGGIVGGVVNEVANLKALFAPRHAASPAAAAPAASGVTAADAPIAQSGGPAGALEASAGVATGDTDLASRPLVKGDLRTFDVSGFRVGMSAYEVQRVAASLHLTTGNGARMVTFDAEKDGTRGPSFQSRVERDAATRLGRPIPHGGTVVYEVSLAGVDGDRYILQFLPKEDGARLASVTLVTSPRGQSPESWLAAVAAKYGKAPESRIAGITASAKWCSRDDPVCDERPAFTARTDDREAVLFLSAGGRERIANDKRIEAAAAAVASSAAGKPTF